MAVSLVSTGITFPDATTQTTAASAVTAGNGISVSSGTVAVACPTHNTVGSYCMCYSTGDNNAVRTMDFGTNYSAGNGIQQLKSGYVYYQDNAGATYPGGTSSELSGTWKWLGGTVTLTTNQYVREIVALACRVS